LGNAMKLASTVNRIDKVSAIAIMGLLLISSIVSFAPLATAATPPTIPGMEEYAADYGLLHNDTYDLYPWEKKSINVGFSKYGEMINPEEGVGLEYDGIDVFANPNVPEEKWSSGWLINIHYTDKNYLKNVWAYALYTDWSGEGGIGGPWRQMQESIDASAPGDENGGRRTSGWAETDDIRLIYDGPRKAIYLLRTTIYDKDPDDGGTGLVEIVIQLVFDKVKKYVMEIKDIKRIDDDKMRGPFQIEFSQRGEWDLGDTMNPKAYTEFYDGLVTKYNKHPFYYPEGDEEVTYDLCQIIDENEDYVGFAAFWPHLISKWVTGSEVTTRKDVLTSMETTTHHIELPPTSEDPLPQGVELQGNGRRLVITLPFRAVDYPRGEGEWASDPGVFVKKDGGWEKMRQGIEWTWNDDTDRHVVIQYPYFNFPDEFMIVYKKHVKGEMIHEGLIPLDCMPEGLFVDPMPPSYGMYTEPRVPYVMAEWDFDLDYDDVDASTHHFRCVSVYGVTDDNNAVDPDMDDGMEFRIDWEVQYQLNEAFNPWDLSDAAQKDTFRWAQKGDLEEVITLDSHLHDRYYNWRDCLEGVHEMVVTSKWGQYCGEDEKVILYDIDGEFEPQLLSRIEEQYTVEDFTIALDPDEIDDYDEYEYYKVLYSTRLVDSWDEEDFEARGYEFDIDVSRECGEEEVTWKVAMGDLGSHTSTGVQLVIGEDDLGPRFLLGWSPGDSTVSPIYKEYLGGWGPASTTLPSGMTVSGGYNEDYYEIAVPRAFLGCPFYWAMNVEATSPAHFGTSSSQQMRFPEDWTSWDLIPFYEDPGCCWDMGRWEWIVVGEESLAPDSAGASMASSALQEWKNMEAWLSGLDVQSDAYAPTVPYVLRRFQDAYEGRFNFHYYHSRGDHRSAFRDDWCQPPSEALYDYYYDEEGGDEVFPTLYPYAVSSSDIVVVGGPIVNEAASYFNDFTDALIYTEYCDGFYSPACWARTSQPSLASLEHQEVDLDEWPADELWYGSDEVGDRYGYALVSTYKDLNGTVGLVVYGYTAEDTYYACYALRGGLLPWLQTLQEGVTTLILELDYEYEHPAIGDYYEGIHPVGIHVKECLGTFTECTGFDTNFKTDAYEDDLEYAAEHVEEKAEDLGICYKLVDITWCAQVHPDP